MRDDDSNDEPAGFAPPEPPVPEFSPQDTVLLDALAAGLSHVGAAGLAGVSTKTVQRRLEVTAFATAVAVQRRQRADEITGLLQAASHDAVRTLVDSLGSLRSGEAIRAANAILEHARRYASNATLNEFNLRLMALRDEMNRNVDPGREQAADVKGPT